MISAVFMMNSKGKVLVTRFFRDDVNRKVLETFKANIVQAVDGEIRSPVNFIDSVSYFHIKHSNVYFCAVTKQNANAALVFEYLNAMIKILQGYFSENFSDDTIQENFSLIYELLDEIIDFGYPQTTDVDVLKMVVTQANKRLFDFGRKKEQKAPDEVTKQVTGDVSWRPLGLKYRKNELFIDVIESVNLLMSTKDTVLRADVTGQVVIKAYLSGMPECKLGVNDRLVMDREPRGPKAQAGPPVADDKRKPGGIEIDDCTFHQCVRLGKWDSDRSVSFIPPDGEFTLMSYRITENINLPFRIKPHINVLGRTRLEVKVHVKANFNFKLFASGVIVRIPVPKNTARTTIVVSIGKAKFDAALGAMVWKIRRVQGDTEFNLSAEVELISSVGDKTTWSRPPISMDFQVPMFTASGLFVRFLKVQERSRYTPIKWVRYITKAGVYENRI